MKYLRSKTVEIISEWNTKECLKIVVSFLNSNNGVIYVGINNDGYICGINNLKNTLINIKDSIKNSILPYAESLCKVTTELVDNKHIIVINIKKGNKLYYIKKYGRSSLGCFYRENTFCLSMSENEIEKRFVASIDRIQLKDIGTIHSDLSFKAMKLLLLSNKQPINENDFLTEYNLLTNDKKYNLLAWLLSDENQTPLIVSTFDSIDKSNFTQRKDFGNRCLLASIIGVIDYFDAINKVFIKIDKTRKELTSFDIEVFKEAWINACVHNKWETNQIPQVYKYSNRIEIISWGGIPNNLTEEEFLKGLSKPINPDLMNIFIKCNLSKGIGLGVPIIIEKYTKQAFKFFEDRIVITIPINEYGFNNNDF